jgi:hypothetical protein
MIIPDKISAYLNKRASTIWRIENDHKKYFQKIIVVPSIAESHNLPVLLTSLEQNDGKQLDNTLLLIIVNNDISSTEEVKEDNRKTFEFLRNLQSKINISYIDAYSKGKEMDDKNGGVGLARKIGMDLALTKFDYNFPNNNILICTDADCTIDSNYLSKISQEFDLNNYEAAVVNFTHDISGNDEETKAIICYEIFLRYYVLGLHFAKSHYAFHTIGSTMACTPLAYVKAGGMNKNKAAEDFYFLEKLAKIYTIGEIKSTYVHPSKRGSWRVPFGTGRSVDRYLAGSKNEYTLYDPKCFVVLKKWLEIFYNSNSEFSYLLESAKKINSKLNDFLIEQDLKNFVQKLRQKNINASEMKKQKNYWFDAFKTLKLIHYLRDKAHPNINMFDTIDELLRLRNDENKISRNSDIPDLETQKEYLLLLRKIQN